MDVAISSGIDFQWVKRLIIGTLLILSLALPAARCGGDNDASDSRYKHPVQD
jgi:hypothetical protein